MEALFIKIQFDCIFNLNMMPSLHSITLGVGKKRKVNFYLQKGFFEESQNLCISRI